MAKRGLNTLSLWKDLWKGLRLTLAHLLKGGRSRQQLAISDPAYFSRPLSGAATLQYPHELLPVPDTGRYRLHNEIDDCIVCDKCVKICPVDCITIDAIRSKEAFGTTSDGTPKRIYAAKFDIDMGKCCFCGLCTTVCPTECLTMTKVFDFSVTDIAEHNFSFANMPAEMIEQKRQELADYELEKASRPRPAGPQAGTPKPIIKPRNPTDE